MSVENVVGACVLGAVYLGMGSRAGALFSLGIDNPVLRNLSYVMWLLLWLPILVVILALGVVTGA